eukprot:scaffold1466_cov385-Prasinococcus_capsulatus_cf.AAC.13
MPPHEDGPAPSLEGLRGSLRPKLLPRRMQSRSHPATAVQRYQLSRWPLQRHQPGNVEAKMPSRSPCRRRTSSSTPVPHPY